MGEVLSVPLQKVLQERRRRLNSLFLQARVTYPTLTGDTFLPHLRDTIIPIAEKAYSYDSSCVVVVLETLYQISLKLVAQGLMGPRALNGVVEQGWRDLLCAHPNHLCRDPLILATSISNALIHLAGMHPQKATIWQEAMHSLGALSQTSQDWLKAGQVAAWRCGLAQYRGSAIEAARSLEPGVGSRAIGLSEALSHEAYHVLLDRLSKQPWVRPEEWLTGGPAKAELKLFSWTGGFVGFGGYFAIPPVPYVMNDRIFLQDDANVWQLEADCFGVSLMRAHSELSSNPNNAQSLFKIQKDGTIASNYGNFAVTAAEGASSYAAIKTTVVIVPKHSHTVAVLGLSLPEANYD